MADLSYVPPAHWNHPIHHELGAFREFPSMPVDFLTLPEDRGQDRRCNLSQHETKRQAISRHKAFSCVTTRHSTSLTPAFLTRIARTMPLCPLLSMQLGLTMVRCRLTIKVGRDGWILKGRGYYERTK